MRMISEVPGTGSMTPGLRKMSGAGFTLLELLVVMAIMVILMSLGTAGYFGMRRGAEMRGATSIVQTTLMLARQQAVTKRRFVELRFLTNGSNAMQVVETGIATTVVHEVVSLPPGIEFGSLTTNSITFVPMGSAVPSGGWSQEIVLQEKMTNSSAPKPKITVWVLTGTTKVTEE